MAVISILVAMGVLRFIGYTKDANATAMKVDANFLEQAALQYALINDGAWPVGAKYVLYDPDVLAVLEGLLGRKGAIAGFLRLQENVSFHNGDIISDRLYGDNITVRSHFF